MHTMEASGEPTEERSAEYQPPSEVDSYAQITMNMNVNITTTSGMDPPPFVNITSSTSNSPIQSNQRHALPPSLPPLADSKPHSGRRRRNSQNKKPSHNWKKEDENTSPHAKSAFEKLNTLKLLLDCGHLTKDEYQERKTQIINEMTGTSTARLKPSPRRPLQPIMKVVVPHLPPDFSRKPKERADKLSFDPDTLQWTSERTRVKLDLVPFAMGQLRNAHYMLEVGDNGSDMDPKLVVAKFSIRGGEPSAYLSDVEMQAVCAHYAQLYNEHEPPLKVTYAQSWALKLVDRGERTLCSVEEHLDGSYVKYSNNSGYVGKETSSKEERERNTPQAFSHFTFVASDYRLMVVDIQGVNDSYTDPQIHTADGRGFGAGNLGTLGMEKFLQSHRCNEVCRWLGLQSINAQYKQGGTAAPLYQMPFGSAIKKSTGRITEERNTFSTSVTVSEAFGGSVDDTSDVEEVRHKDGQDGLSYAVVRSPSSKKVDGVEVRIASFWWRVLQRLLCCFYCF